MVKTDLAFNNITFFERFETDILSGAKTITIRDEQESHYKPDSVVEVATFEAGRHFCRIKIIAVEPTLLSDLNERHAQQENMTLTELKQVIEDIYPGVTRLYVIHFELV